MYYCYLIYSENKTYIGITNDLNKRIKQHNGLLKGGAKATRSSSQWRYYIVVTGFKNKSEVMKFEWLWKHQQTRNNKWKRTPPTIKMKITRLISLLIDTQWYHVSIFNHYL